MDNHIAQNTKRTFLDKILDKKAIIIIIFGIAIRVIMLIYYYYTHSVDPLRSWGDLGSYFEDNLTSPPLTIFILELFRFLSFGSIQLFAFWGFFWDLLTVMMVYFVIKSFNIKYLNYVFGLFLINPFFFLNNSFSLDNCGYHITDAFFFFFFFLALIFYPKQQKYSRFLFYIFLALSMCSKYYSLPAVVFFFLKYLFEKNWKEMKIFIVSVVPILTIFLLIPIFLTDWFINVLIEWALLGTGAAFPIYVKVIPPLMIALLFIFLRLKKSDAFEISIISTIVTASFMIFSYAYLRWFQLIIFYGILKEKDFFTLNVNLGFLRREVKVNNHLITFYLSFIAVFFAYLLIVFLYT